MTQQNPGLDKTYSQDEEANLRQALVFLQQSLSSNQASGNTHPAVLAVIAFQKKQIAEITSRLSQVPPTSSASPATPPRPSTTPHIPKNAVEFSITINNNQPGGLPTVAVRGDLSGVTGGGAGAGGGGSHVRLSEGLQKRLEEILKDYSSMGNVHIDLSDAHKGVLKDISEKITTIVTDGMIDHPKAISALEEIKLKLDGLSQ